MPSRGQLSPRHANCQQEAAVAASVAPGAGEDVATGAGKGPSWLVPDDRWDQVEQWPPVRQQRLRKLSRPPLDDYGCLEGILFTLHVGIRWERLPQELCFGSGTTC
ncbi:transposase [Streptomyces sp. NPDC053560]|uniref:transposase n=1 Tax=Streptomyces sp. NPDC053560 TaxID=3365711 RepID=UPI0037D52E15